MSDPSLDDLARRLQELPREAWDRPVPPPPPWPAEEVSPARRRFVVRPLAAVAASVALLATGLAAGLLLSSDDETPAPGAPGTRVELRPVDGRGQGASGVVRLEPRAGGSANVRLSGLRPSEGGDFYELWLLGEGGELVSLGSVRVPASGVATLENVRLPVDPERFSFLDVSREPGDGDPGHSSISVLRGPAT